MAKYQEQCAYLKIKVYILLFWIKANINRGAIGTYGSVDKMYKYFIQWTQFGRQKQTRVGRSIIDEEKVETCHRYDLGANAGKARTFEERCSFEGKKADCTLPE